MSKRTNSSYYDLGKITPYERTIIMSMIEEEVESENKKIEEIKNNKLNRR